MTLDHQREKRRRSKTPSWQIDAVRYWSNKIHESDIGCDWADASIRCWRCGHMRKCQKCHIIPHSMGGTDEPSNIVALCAQCHDEAPDVADPSAIWEWIRRDHGVFYDTYWTERAMKHVSTDWSQMSVQALKENLLKVCTHFGQCSGGVRIKPSSIAWAIEASCPETPTK